MGLCLSGLAAEGIFAAATWLEWALNPASWWVVLQVAGGFGFVIFVHELGHFLVAKACGVKCEKFFIGFDVGGLKLASFKWGETEYGIGALPLGGYVKMLGQDDNPAAAAKEADRARAAFESGDLPPEPVSGPHPAWDPRSYPAQTVPERMAIISAGVIMNVIFAILMASWAFGLGVRELTCAVSGVRPGGAAWRAGLRTGDEITAIGTKKNPIFSDLQKGVTLGDVSKGVEFTIRRPADGATKVVTLRPDTDLGVPTVGVTSPFSLTLPKDLPRNPAKDPGEGLPGAAGRAQPPLLAGDTITAVDGTPVASYAELIAALARVSERPVQLAITRTPEGGKATTLSVEVPAQEVRSTGMTMTAMPVRAVQDDSPAAAAGVEVGDLLVAVDGEPIGDPFTLDARLRGKSDSEIGLTVERSGARREIRISPRNVTWIEESRWPASPVSLSSIGVAIGVDAVVADVDADGPASRAGIRPGERITAVRFLTPGPQGSDGRQADGLELSKTSPSWPYVMAALQQVDPGTKLKLTISGGDGGSREVTLEPETSPGRFVVDRGLLFEPVYRMVRAGSFMAALRQGFGKAIDDLSLVYTFLQKMTSNQISPRMLGGPIEIAKQAGKSAEEGFSRFLLFLTMLSANLAVVNFLPIPVLDGGHMVFLFYELIRGKPPSEGVVAALSYVGLALILTLMMFVFGLDLGLIPRR